MERLQLHNSTPAPLKPENTPTKEQEELKEEGKDNSIVSYMH